VIGCSANCAILERKENFTNLVSSYALSIGYVFYIIDIDIDIDIDIELKLNWYWIDIDIELILSSILRTMVVYIKKKKIDHDLQHDQNPRANHILTSRNYELTGQISKS
jgi:hypothetical protein